MGDHVEGDAPGGGYRRERLQRIEVRPVHDVRRDHHARAGRIEQRVAVGIRARDRVEADVAVAAGAVLDQETLAQRLAQAGADHARGDVGHAAGGDVDDHAHRLARPRLCMANVGQYQSDNEKKLVHGCPYCALMFASLITLPHFCTSLRTNAANSSGLSPPAVVPSEAASSWISLCCRTAAMS